MYTIYGLVDPRTFLVRYIGVTKNHPSVRLLEHLEAKDKAAKKNLWISGLKSLNLKPSLVILDFAVDLDAANEKERWWINHAIVSGWELTNGSHTQTPKDNLGKACRKIAPVHRTVSELNPDKLTPMQQMILNHIQQYPDVGVRERARILGVTPGYVSKIQQRQEELRQ